MVTDPDSLPNANLRARSYFIARSRVNCPHCGVATWLTALALGAGHETLDDELDEWEAVQANAFCFDVAAVSRTVYRCLRKHAPQFKFVRNVRSEQGYWANHCQHCDRIIVDDELHGEPGVQGFVLCSKVHAASISLMEVCEPFEALAGGYALEPEFFAFMRHE